MEFQLFLIVVVIVLLVIVFSARQGLRGGGSGTRAEPRRQCPGCMTSLPAHARFCARCGRKQG